MVFAQTSFHVCFCWRLKAHKTLGHRSSAPYSWISAAEKKIAQIHMVWHRSKTRKDNKNTSSNALCPQNKSHMSFGGNLSKFHLWNDICKRISKYIKLETEHLLCVWAYVSCHVSHAQRLTTKGPKASALLFESGEMAVTLPIAALPSCGFGFTNVKLKS